MTATATWGALGTGALVLVADPAALPEARAAVEAELAEIDAACSRFRDDSELVALNAVAGRRVAVTPLLLEAIEVALRAARITAGDVDPTVGRSLRLAGYDRDFARLVDDGPAPRLVPAGGWRRVALDREAATVRVPDGTELDLGATAKALAADRAAAAAHAATGAGVLVSLGGDMATAGPPPDGGWTVRVAEDHAAGPDAPGQTIALRGGGLATSSTTVRRWRRAGRELHHILDPRTGAPATPHWRTVSVAAGSCVDANVAATAAIVRGAPARAWLEAQRLPARLVAGPDGAVSTVAGWPA